MVTLAMDGGVIRWLLPDETDLEFGPSSGHFYQCYLSSNVDQEKLDSDTSNSDHDEKPPGNSSHPHRLTR